jgi:hypothetical protein
VELGQVSTDKLEAITNIKGTMSRDFLDSGLYSNILLVLAHMPRKDFEFFFENPWSYSYSLGTSWF